MPPIVSRSSSSPSNQELEAVVFARVDVAMGCLCDVVSTGKASKPTMNAFSSLTVLLSVLLLATPTVAGPLTALGAYGLCQSGCNVVCLACYTAAGAVMGTVTAGVGTPVAVLGCNAALGTCMAGCAAVTIGTAATPTP